MNEVLEAGDVAFFYRPKVQQEQASDLADVQRLLVALRPHGEDRFRLLVIGRKQLPEIEEHERFWGFVNRVGDLSSLEEELARIRYTTATRGERVQPEARPAGEGLYALVRHGDHTHFVYVLELPEDPGEVQEALNIRSQGSYVVSVKNPEVPTPAGLPSAQQRVDYPDRLRDRFGGRRWIASDPAELLDYEGTQLLFIGAARDISDELGIELEPQDESAATADVFSELRLRRDRHPTAPLFAGEWR